MIRILKERSCISRSYHLSDHFFALIFWVWTLPSAAGFCVAGVVYREQTYLEKWLFNPHLLFLFGSLCRFIPVLKSSDLCFQCRLSLLFCYCKRWSFNARLIIFLLINCMSATYNLFSTLFILVVIKECLAIVCFYKAVDIWCVRLIEELGSFISWSIKFFLCL